MRPRRRRPSRRIVWRSETYQRDALRPSRRDGTASPSVVTCGRLELVEHGAVGRRGFVAADEPNLSSRVLSSRFAITAGRSLRATSSGSSPATPLPMLGTRCAAPRQRSAVRSAPAPLRRCSPACSRVRRLRRDVDDVSGGKPPSVRDDGLAGGQRAVPNSVRDRSRQVAEASCAPISPEFGRARCRPDSRSRRRRLQQIAGLDLDALECVLEREISRQRRRRMLDRSWQEARTASNSCDVTRAIIASSEAVVSPVASIHGRLTSSAGRSLGPSIASVTSVDAVTPRRTKWASDGRRLQPPRA